MINHDKAKTGILISDRNWPCELTNNKNVLDSFTQ